MSDYTPSTDHVRSNYTAYEAEHTQRGLAGDDENDFDTEFDRWLEQHDHETLVDYESRRRMDPIRLENIDGKNAKSWIAEEIRMAKAEAWEQGVGAQLGYEQDKAHPMTTKPVPYPTNPHRQG